jgi:hypothetical protein
VYALDPVIPKIKPPSSRTDADVDDTPHRPLGTLCRGLFFVTAPVDLFDQSLPNARDTREIKTTPLEESALMFHAIKQILMTS